MSESTSTSKRKRNAQCIKTKLEILQKLEEGFSAKTLSSMYGIGLSTIYDLKSQKSAILSFYSKIENPILLEKRKTMYLPKNADVDKVLFEWIKEKTSENFPLTRSVIMAQAKIFHELLDLKDNCEYTGVWFNRFKERNGLQMSSGTGTTEFYVVDEFMNILEAKSLTTVQVYNPDETELSDGEKARADTEALECYVAGLVDMLKAENITLEQIFSPDKTLLEKACGLKETKEKIMKLAMDIRGMVVRCTSCLHQINHHDKDKVWKHYRLNVIVCKECHEFYGTSEFSQDESGNFNYCTWCGNGGKLFLCDFCPNAFCSTCVRRNFGRAEVSKMSREGWKCYCCEPSQLKTKVAYCDLIIAYSKKAKLKNLKIESKLGGGHEKVKNRNVENWIENQDWVLLAFNEVDDSCNSMRRRLAKLRNIGMRKSKSVKHVVTKIEEVVNNHKSELNQIIKILSRTYSSYLKAKKLEEDAKREEKMKKAEEESEDELETENHIKDNQDLKNPVRDEGSDTSKGNSVGMDSPLEDASKIDANYIAKLALLKDSESSESEKESVKSESESKTNEIDLADAESQDIFPEPEIKDTLPSKLLVNGTSNPSEHSPVEAKSEVNNKPHVEVGKSSDRKKIPLNIIPSKSKKQVAKGKKSVNRKLQFVDLSSGSDAGSSSSIIVSSDTGSAKKKPKITPKKPRKEKKLVDLNDPKLKLKPILVLESCDNLLLNGETTIPVPEEYLVADLDKEIKNLCKLPKEKAKSKNSDVPEKPKEKKQKKAPEPKKKKVVESSSSISFSSSEEDKPGHKDLFSATKEKDANALAKEQLLDYDESSSSSSSPDSEEVKKKKSKKPKAKSDSSDDFQPTKKRKFDKLLSKRILSDEENSKDSDKKPGDKKRMSKRKQPASDDSKSDKRDDSNSEHTTTSDSEEEKQKKKKRKRIKKAAASSSEEENNKDKDVEGSQNTPGKHRKNIKKILSKKELADETREAQEIEKERRRRVMERQKLYNMITDTAKDGKEIITRKMVLEIDPDSKEEIVEIHPDLVEKLKPHQVKGVKFMWECTIESVKELKKKDSTGSGCILAHCMGLGKTLQVITFLHTCLTNEHVKGKIRTAMVICPYNTILNWAREFETWLKDIDGEILIHELAQAKDNYTRLDIIKYWQRDGGVLIISYDIYRRLANPAKKGLKLPKAKREKLIDLLVDPGPDIVICDEGHALKNVKSAISIACGKFATERRIVLTGTPLQNNLLEYHCMLSFVKPHLLGTPKEFRNRFVNPIMNGQYDDSNDHDVKRMKKRIHILHKLLGGCVQRCDYSALTKFLPPKHEYVINVKLSEVQIKMYGYYLDNLSRHKQDVKIQGGTLFKDYNILMNLCTHPFIVHKSFVRSEHKRILRDDSEDEDEYEKDFIDDGTESNKSGSASSNSETEEVVRSYKTRSRVKDAEEGSDIEEIEEDIPVKNWYHEFISDEDKFRIEISGKMVLLVDILRECDAIGDKVILFSQSILTLDTVEEVLEHLDAQPLTEEDKQRDVRGSWVKGLDYFRMDGTTSAEFRKNFIDMFNNPKNDRARLFLVSTKAGGLGTNLVGANRVVMLDASWNPSHDVQAIFRVYRFGQTKPVYIYRLLAQGTMEEKIYDRQVTKLSLSIRVVDEQQIDRHFNADQLAELYKFEPHSLGNKPTPMVPKDTLLAEMLKKRENWIVTYHEHDSLLQNETEEDLTEEERQAAWAEYENEREGRFTEEISIDEEIAQYIKEPDFNEADYAGSVIASVKTMIEEIIGNLKMKFPNFSPPDLRKKLLLHIFRLRALFQDKHVRILRVKQEYVANGAVPQSINKYLQELNVVLKDLTTHYENIQQLVKHDQVIAMEQYKEQLKKQQAIFMAAQAAAAKQMPHGNAMPNQQFAGRVPSYRPGFQSFPQNMQYGGYAMPNAGMPFIGQNTTLHNIRRGMMNYANRFNYTNQNVPGANHSTQSAPVITEVVDVENERGETILPDKTKNSNAKSSVVIEEVE